MVNGEKKNCKMEGCKSSLSIDRKEIILYKYPEIYSHPIFI